MQEVGVEAVVKGLQAFLGDMGKVNSSLNSLRPSATLLQLAFEAVGTGIQNFGASVARVVETALGVMLRDAIEGLIRAFGDLVKAIFETGAEFQTLKIRLTGLNLNDFVDGVRSFDEALGLARDKTIEEITWLQTLGAQTPFDPAQIADTYTQARAFGFAADEAKRLTEDIINYTAGMGLSNETLFLVIQNMGQMVQRGKITGTEIRDLARGSFLPLADVLERIAKNMGITVKELTKEISTKEGVPAAEFVKAFEQMVEEEPRFVGAAGRMSRALLPASLNVKELITSVFGLNTVSPIFDILGEKIAGLVDTFVAFNKQGDLVKTQKWDDLVAAATNLGITLGYLIKQLLGFLPTSASIADTIIAAIQGLAIWIGENRENIVGFFVGIGNAIQTFVIEPFKRIVAWVTENWPLITEFFSSLGAIVSDVFGQLFGGKFKSGDFLGGLLEGLKTFMQFVIDNKDQIADWAVKFIKVFVVVQLLLTAFNIFIGVLLAVGGAILSVIGAIVGVIGFISTFGMVIFTVIGVVSSLIDKFVILPAALDVMQIGISLSLKAIYERFKEFFDTVRALYGYFQVQLGDDPDAMNDWLSEIPEKMRVVVFDIGYALQSIIALFNYFKVLLITNDPLNDWVNNIPMELRAGAEMVGFAWQQFVEIFNAQGIVTALQYLEDVLTNFEGHILPSRITHMTDIVTNGFGTMGAVMLNFPSVVLNMILSIAALFTTMQNNIVSAMNQIRNFNWSGIGSGIVQGIASGISSSAGLIINAAVNAARNAYNATLSFLHMHSPSGLFMEVGALTMEGFSQGIEKYAAVASKTMGNAMSRVAAPAIAMPAIIQSVVAGGSGSTVSNTDTRNYNLTVNSGANTEPIIQDFNMLSSMAG